MPIDPDPRPTAQPATRVQRLTNAFLTSVFRLRIRAGHYTVTRGIGVPMRDGVVLRADLYAPRGESKGTVLVRCPYGRALPYSLLFADLYAARGYHVLLQSCRGTFGSDGSFEPMVHEIDDSADTVAWLRDQPWFAGRLATIGLSYLGFTQWALLMDPPPELVASVVLVGPHDFSRAAYGTGAFSLNDFLGWTDMVAHQEDVGLLRGLWGQLTATRRLSPALARVPLATAGADLWGDRAPWYADWVAHSDITDPFWGTMQLGAALERAETPILLIGGWQDLFLDQTLDQYAHLRARDVDVALTVGPWTHLETIGRGAGVIARDTVDWLEEHLAGTRGRARTAVRVFVTGAEEWRDLAAWPPSTTAHTYFPHPEGGLGTVPAGPGDLPACFVYEPADPTPTVGGRLLSADGGYRDDTALGERSDVLAFTGPPLSVALEVMGAPVVELAHTSDNPHADLFVRLSEVDPKGRSRNVADGFVRLGPTTSSGTVRLELDQVAHRFAAGNRLRLLVAGGCHPRWDRNLGTGESPATGTTMKASSRAVDLAGSRMVLPITT